MTAQKNSAKPKNLNKKSTKKSHKSAVKIDSKKFKTKVSTFSKLQRLSLFFIDKARITLILWAVLAMFGVLSYSILLPREGFPTVNIPIGSISGSYFVQNQVKVDQEIAHPLSTLVKNDERVKSVFSSSSDNFYFLQLEFNEGVKPEEATRDIENKVKAEGLLPNEATAEFKAITFSIDPEGQGDNLLISFYSLGQDSDADQLQSKAKQVQEFLSGVNGIKGAERVRVVERFKSAINPATNQPQTIQTSYDLTATRGDSLKLRNSAMIAVKADANTDELELFDQTSLALTRLRENSEFKEYNAVISANLAESVRSQINNLQENLATGLVAVLIISFLIIGLRASFVIALAMITTLAISVGILYVVGLTLNTITLFALILSLGLIVDDATVMVEAIDASRRNKKSRRDVAAEGVGRVAKASIAGTFTTMLGFAPLLFIGGILGEFIFAVPLTIMINLAVSLTVSLTLVPFLSRIIIPNSNRVTKNLLDGVQSSISHKLSSMILIGKKSRQKLVAVGMVMILFSLTLTFIGLLLFGKVRFNIFPATKDSNQILVNMRFDEGAKLQDAQATATAVTQKVIDKIGQNIQKTSLYGTGSEKEATLYVELIPYEDREATSHQIIEETSNALSTIDGVDVSVAQIDAGPPAGNFNVRVYSDDSTKANTLTQDLIKFLADIVLIRPDGSRVSALNVRQATQSQLTRQDGELFWGVTADFDADDTSAIVRLAQDAVEEEFTAQKIASYELPANALRFDFGEESNNQESFASMIIAFPILIIAMYLLLLLLFRSFTQPLLIFVAIPFVLFGVMGGLYLTNNPFSFFTMIGLFALLGISVNNTILLTDFANRARRDGHDRLESMSIAIKERFRPLVTTSLTSVVALTPLAITNPFWESLAVTLIFGLLSSTLLVILAFPYYYLALEFLRQRITALSFILWVVGLVISVSVVAMLEGNPGVVTGLYLVATLILKRHWKKL